MEQRAEEVKRAMEIASEKDIPVEYLLPANTPISAAPDEPEKNKEKETE
jgi:hypothetical protein